jgi:hypothetical protein
MNGFEQHTLQSSDQKNVLLFHAQRLAGKLDLKTDEGRLGFYRFVLLCSPYRRSTSCNKNPLWEVQNTYLSAFGFSGLSCVLIPAAFICLSSIREK